MSARLPETLNTRVNSVQRMAELLVRYRWWSLTLVVAVSCLAAGPASRLELDESIESFYAPGDPLLRGYLESKATFGGDEFVMAAYEVDDPASEEHLDDLARFGDELSRVPGINSESTQDLSRVIRNPRALEVVPFLMRLPTTKRMLTHMSRQILIGDDDRTVAVVMRLLPEGESPVSRRETFAEVRRIAAAHNPPALVAGEPVQVHDMFRYVEADGWVLGTASSVSLMVVILILFRSVRWVILPLLLVHITLLWTRGLLQVSGLKLSMVSSMLTSLVTIIAVATTMHITVQYREWRRDHGRRESLIFTIRQLSAPIFWTCLTTAAGFASLLTSGITPVRSFGIMMAVGTLLVPLLCLLVLPGGTLSGRRDADPGRVFAESHLMTMMSAIASWVVRRRGIVIAWSGLLAIGAVAGLSELRVETDFSKNFRASSDIVQALQFYETRLGGVGTWEVGFSAPRELDDEYLNKVRGLATALQELSLPGGNRITRVVALTDGLDPVRKLPKPGRGLFGVLNRRTLSEALETLQILQPEFECSLYNAELGRMRIVLRAMEQQPAEVKLKLIAAVESTAKKYFPDAQVTGLYVLLAELISSLLRDQLLSFAVAATAIALLMSLAFRSLTIGIVTLAPNILPILLVIGGMGLIGIPINIGTAMIASVSMGLTIDSSIHYLTGYIRRTRSGVAHAEALRQTHADVGRALIFANIALVLGFSVLTLSQFIPLVYFGVLVSVAMCGGLAGNLLLLPALLDVAYGRTVIADTDGDPATEPGAVDTASGADAELT